MRNFLLTVFFVFSIGPIGYAQLVVNELSQGPPATAMEYVEMVVTGNAACDSQCVDIRGWIFDDNNGFHASGSGTGIAQGHMRFAFHPQWQCVKPGTIILVYNNGQYNSSWPPIDEYDANNDCVYVLPGNSALFQHHPTLPYYLNQSYVVTSYLPGGAWNTTSMSNNNDSYHTIDPANLNVAYHAVSWNNNTNNTNIYFAGTMAAKVVYMANVVNDNPSLQANWLITSSAGNETPGAPNNPANAAWIDAMSFGCGLPGPPGVWTWNGSVSNNWFNPCNWDKWSLPDTSSQVSIPGPTPNQPLVAVDTAYCKTITIDVSNGAHVYVDVSSGGKLIKKP